MTLFCLEKRKLLPPIVVAEFGSGVLLLALTVWE
jgi:hypothetical protein